MSKSNGYGTVTEVPTKPEHLAKAELRDLIEAGKLDDALALAKKMRAQDQMEQKAHALELIGGPGELNLDGIIGALEIAQGAGNKPTVVFEDATHNFEAGFPPPILKAKEQGGAILSAGEVCLLSAQGGAGKSTLACALAVQFASHSPTAYKGIFENDGGSVAYITKEDTTKVLRKRMQLYAKHMDDTLPEDTLSRVKLTYINEPIFGVPEGAHQGVRPETLPMWDAVWEQIYDLSEPPKLIIFDTISKVYAASQIEPGGINDFVDNLKEAASKIGAGVLLIGHSNKEARKGNADPFEPGQVSGSSAWHDAVRGVMTLTYTELGLILACPKANYGKSDIWLGLATLRAREDGMPLAYEGKTQWQEKREYYEGVKELKQTEGKTNGKRKSSF